MSKAGIVAFAFGTPFTIKPNRSIAEIASKKARELKAVVYTQIDMYIDDDVPVEYVDEEGGYPAPTLRIAREAVKWAKKHKIAELWVVAAKPHLPRALRDVRKAVREARAQIKVYAGEEIEYYPANYWFCRDSTQNRTRSRWAWKWRERILKLTPFFIYRHLAG